MSSVTLAPSRVKAGACHAGARTARPALGPGADPCRDRLQRRRDEDAQVGFGRLAVDNDGIALVDAISAALPAAPRTECPELSPRSTRDLPASLPRAAGLAAWNGRIPEGPPAPGCGRSGSRCRAGGAPWPHLRPWVTRSNRSFRSSEVVQAFAQIGIPRPGRYRRGAPSGPSSAVASAVRPEWTAS